MVEDGLELNDGLLDYTEFGSEANCCKDEDSLCIFLYGVRTTITKQTGLGSLFSEFHPNMAIVFVELFLSLLELNVNYYFMVINSPSQLIFMQLVLV